MGWQDRDYASEEGYYRVTRTRSPFRLSGMRLSTVLIIINVGIFILDSLSRTERTASFIEWGAMNTEYVLMGQVWRLITSQYLHADVWHLFFNMLGLYFLGRYLEQHWGKRRFFVFYTACGLAGNLFFMFLNITHWLPSGIMIGASGCILGVLGACAVLFPGIQLIVYFFPMKIRTAAALFLGLYVLNLLNKGGNAGGDAAHLAGLVVGAGYAYWGGRLLSGLPKFQSRPFRASRKKSPWSRKLDKEMQLNETVDRILAKINEQGIASLTQDEKRTLAEASKRQRQDKAEFERMNKL